ncbi:MAG: NAD(P)H-dependent dehydrogenase/reductase [Deltaproteobacteria bacterium HGW-Deltaproteobacteria-15]|jgi:nitroreductase|nr:MAG: NAD(P)H-dependent dehydrogenase/reductase [Deltaproteobacteria bacterium HGW-Deltaproteobacteria-15]
MFLELVRKRRSIRRYSDRPVEPEKLDTLIEAALRSPSSIARKPWEFILVRDPALLDQLSRAKQHGSSFLRYASAGIVVCADPMKSDVWVEDASIACIMILLAAESLGLGGCWVQMRERNHSDSKTAGAYVREVLSIPERLKVQAIMSIGYPADHKEPHPMEDLLFDRVNKDQYGTAYR